LGSHNGLKIKGIRSLIFGPTFLPWGPRIYDFNAFAITSNLQIFKKAKAVLLHNINNTFSTKIKNFQTVNIANGL
jgi:hypothetical protein